MRWASTTQQWRFIGSSKIRQRNMLRAAGTPVSMYESIFLFYFQQHWIGRRTYSVTSLPQHTHISFHLIARKLNDSRMKKGTANDITWVLFLNWTLQHSSQQLDTLCHTLTMVSSQTSGQHITTNISILDYTCQNEQHEQRQRDRKTIQWHLLQRDRHDKNRVHNSNKIRIILWILPIQYPYSHHNNRSWADANISCNTAINPRKRRR